MWPLCPDGCSETLPDTADPPSPWLLSRVLPLQVTCIQSAGTAVQYGCAVAVSVLVVWGRGGTLIMSLSSSPGLFCPLGTPPTSHAHSAASQTSSLKLILYFNLPAHRAPHPAKLNLATVALNPSKIST